MKFKIPVVWMQRGVVEVEADTIEAAMKSASDGVEFPEDPGEPIDDTMELDCFDSETIISVWNS